MVFKALIAGNSGSFNNAADSYGYFNDIVYGVYEPATFGYVIRTYRGDDLIELRDLYIGSDTYIYAGAGNDTVYGHAGIDLYYDQTGNDNVVLGAGNDAAYLGLGNDTLDGGSGPDWINFDIRIDDNGNFSTNTSAVTIDLQKTTVQNFGVYGYDTIKNFEKVYAGGSNDKIYGTSAANELYVNGGNDFIDGRAGNDTLNGGEGSDTIVGGTGGDRIYIFDATAARDYVRYNKATESSATSYTQNSADWIINFDKGGGTNDDKIDFSRIDARASTTTINEAFVWRNAITSVNAPTPSTIFGTSASGEVKIIEYAGDSIVFVDTDGDRAAEMIIVVNGVTGLNAVDFIL